MRSYYLMLKPQHQSILLPDAKAAASEYSTIWSIHVGGLELPVLPTEVLAGYFGQEGYFCLGFSLPKILSRLLIRES